MNGHDEGRGLWRVFDLFAQFGDVHVNGSGERNVVVVPHRVEQAFSRQDLAAVVDQETQQLELAWRERQVLAVLERLGSPAALQRFPSDSP